MKTAHSMMISLGGGMLKPNVSHCIEENEVHYNPWTDPRLIVKYNVNDADEPIRLYNYYVEEGKEEMWVTAALLFDKVEIDGTEVSASDLDTEEGMHQLSSGEHTVAYTLKNPTTIANSAFNYNESLTSVIIPDSVRSIGETAFSECFYLTSITIPDSVRSIGKAAFQICDSLTSATIGNGVTSIGDNAFQDCYDLISVTMGNSVITIGDNAFYQCTSLTSITIPDSVTSIGEGTFKSCTSLTSITIGNSVTNIGYYAFESCSDLPSITIPDSVTSIGESAFLYCESLDDIIIGNGVTEIKANTFDECYGIQNVTLGTGITRIGKNAFSCVFTANKLICKATIPPTVDTGNELGYFFNGIFVPAESVNVYKTASGWSDVANYIQAIPTT